MLVNFFGKLFIDKEQQIFVVVPTVNTTNVCAA